MLPIRKVILYKHGVGFFERQGDVEGDEALSLTFKTTEMNDVLKSLTVLDLSGGRIRNWHHQKWIKKVAKILVSSIGILRMPLLGKK